MVYTYSTDTDITVDRCEKIKFYMFIVILKSMESAKNTTDNHLSFRTKMYYTLVLLKYTAVIFVSLY